MIFGLNFETQTTVYLIVPVRQRDTCTVTLTGELLVSLIAEDELLGHF